MYSELIMASKGTAVVKDMSVGGMQVEVKEKFVEHEKVVVRFSVSSDHILEFVKGVVRWVVKDPLTYRLGIQFVHAKNEERKKLESVMNRLIGKRVGLFSLLRQMTGK